jgi:uncharacterized surface protein with fasciclin (FAS1) repeats
MLRLFITVIAALTALTALPATAEDLLDTARRAGSFKTFIDAVRTAGLTTQMKANGPYTIFMPTDAAFDQLDAGRWEALQQDKDQLSRVLRYHVIPGKVKVTEVKPGKTRSEAGALLALKSDNGMVTVNGARVTESDLAADNGIIHGIDAVLMPPD